MTWMQVYIGEMNYLYDPQVKKFFWKKLKKFRKKVEKLKKKIFFSFFFLCKISISFVILRHQWTILVH